MSFLRRSLYNNPSNTKAQSYKNLIRPIVEYASSAWDYKTQSNINKLEVAHRHAARFVTEDYPTSSSISDIISNLGWETQLKRRTGAKLMMMYRITSQLQLFFIQPLSVHEAIADFVGLRYFSGFPSGLKSHVLISHDFLSQSKCFPLPRDRAAMYLRPASKQQKKFCFESKQACKYCIRSAD